jgi:glutamine amidotransferase
LNAISFLGYRRVKISNQFHDIATADILILPGVGAFEACMDNLRANHLDDLLNELVLDKRKPILGICVGMQLMAGTSEENGVHTGLGWIPGHVVKLDLPSPYTVPHVGWNNLDLRQASPLFSCINHSPHFYFDHSYHYECAKEYVVATCDYYLPVTAAIARNHIYGVQFHPEKSDINGLRLFRTFFEAMSTC